MSTLPGDLRDRSARGHRVGLAVGAITLAGLALRLPSFGDSLFGDELSAYYIVAGHSLGQILHLLDNHSTELNPPLFFLLAWISTKLFGLSPESLKLVSLLAGTVTIPLTYLLGRMTVGVRAALVGCALAAFCPFLVYYSTEARPYALLVALVLGAALALVRATRGDGVGWWALYAVMAAAAAYTHFTAVFALAGLLAWALVTQRARRATALATVAAGALYVPWLPILIGTSRSPGTKLYALLEPFSLHSIELNLGRWAIGHPYLPLSRVPGSVAAAIALGAVVVGVALDAWHARRRTLHGPSPSAAGVALVVVLAAAVPVGAALYSALHQSVWFARNLIASWPGFGLLLGWLVTRTRAVWSVPVGAVLVVAFALGGLTMTERGNRRPDYAAAIAYVDAADPHGGPIADLSGISPGPPSETDAALAFAGTASAHPVFRIGVAPLKEVLAAAPYAPLPPQPGQVVARAVTARAGDGLLFVIAATDVPFSRLQALREQHVHDNASAFGVFATFLGALPARFRPVRSRTFAGFVPVTVYVYRG